MNIYYEKDYCEGSENLHCHLRDRLGKPEWTYFPIWLSLRLSHQYRQTSESFHVTQKSEEMFKEQLNFELKSKHPGLEDFITQDTLSTHKVSSFHVGNWRDPRTYRKY